ncbi:5-oxoprolinase subunit PxpB [Calditerrivibrio nitroreducens]|uniref:Allophanate hydrolase subunit 1 n=1 Tax=Calditerrivibrio nitroreducens (strain DSM 19672 / NBRC 101217 / Yu37-1) TaxID=768670 RepID=E4TEG8_CALNY|nr:5-oxoprolinase subunit PxpB [Calditerrivibrio nitroreducens]ADR18294.1 Allophanate hydrolase subunit 1 [Calditerrivibrio nitroreducens DSM 19672]
MVIEQISDRKIKIILGEQIDIVSNIRINRIVSLIKERFPDCINTIIAYSSAYCEFASGIDMDELRRIFDSFVEEEPDLKMKIVVKEIPVCYDEEFSPDRDFVESYTGLSFEDVVRIHTERIYYIYFLGFLPGFPYLGGLDKRIHIPRRKEPRLLVKAGSVGIGGVQTGIYPLDSPGGWQIIGRTPIKLFDKKRKEPFLLKSSEGVLFKKIDKKEFDEILKDEGFRLNSFTVELKEVIYHD